MKSAQSIQGKHKKYMRGLKKARVNNPYCMDIYGFSVPFINHTNNAMGDRMSYKDMYACAKHLTYKGMRLAQQSGLEFVDYYVCGMKRRVMRFVDKSICAKEWDVSRFGLNYYG